LKGPKRLQGLQGRPWSLMSLQSLGSFTSAGRRAGTARRAPAPGL
jgi:hypothetical protein